MKKIYALVTSLVVAAIIFAAVAPVEAASISSRSTVRAAQSKLNNFGIHAGPADGYHGPKTGRALCTFRWISGMKAHRGKLDTATYNKLNAYKSQLGYITNLKAGKFRGESTYIYVSKTCQTMIYVEHQKIRRVINVSTGKKGHETPNTVRRLGSTQKGWSCSTLYPESCRKQHTGVNKKYSDVGNMYNKRYVKGAIYLHGSNSVPTYPASHGCIRVSVWDSDWMYKHVGNRDTGGRPLIYVGGSY